MKHRVIFLNKGYIALVDADDYDRLSQLQWFAHVRPGGQVYACRGSYRTHKKNGLIYMHKEVLDAPLVDHVSHALRVFKILDNRKANLRAATSAMNTGNSRKLKPGTSRFKGVYRAKVGKPWIAGITVNRKARYLGGYDTEEAAAEAYDNAALEHFGESALTNAQMFGVIYQ